MKSQFILFRQDYDCYSLFRSALLVTLTLVLMCFWLSKDANATTGYMWKGNCYTALDDAYDAMYQEQTIPQYFSVDQYNSGTGRVEGNLYRTFLFYDSTAPGRWRREIDSVVVGSGITNQLNTFTLTLVSNYFYPCTIPDTGTGLAGNGVPTVFSPMYETAKTLVNTQSLMIFLWTVSLFVLGFKFGYYLFNSGAGRNDTF